MTGTASRALDQNAARRVGELTKRERTKRLDRDVVRHTGQLAKRCLDRAATVMSSPTGTPSAMTRRWLSAT